VQISFPLIDSCHCLAASLPDRLNVLWAIQPLIKKHPVLFDYIAQKYYSEAMAQLIYSIFFKWLNALFFSWHFTVLCDLCV